MAREVIYTETLHQALLATIRGGATERDACEAAGIAWSTWSEWKRRVRGGDRFHPGIAALVEDVPQAAAIRNAALTRRLAKLAEKDYRAAVWLLERDAKRKDHSLQIKLTQAQIELARLKIAAGGVERHEVAVVSPELAAAAAREVFGSPSALETNGPARDTSAAPLEVDALPLPSPVDHRAK